MPEKLRVFAVLCFIMAALFLGQGIFHRDSDVDPKETPEMRAFRRAKAEAVRTEGITGFGTCMAAGMMFLAFASALTLLTRIDDSLHTIEKRGRTAQTPVAQPVIPAPPMLAWPKGTPPPK